MPTGSFIAGLHGTTTAAVQDDAEILSHVTHYAVRDRADRLRSPWWWVRRKCDGVTKRRGQIECVEVPDLGGVLLADRTALELEREGELVTARLPVCRQYPKS